MRLTFVSGPKIVVLPIVLTTTVLEVILTVSTLVTVTMNRACAPAPVAVEMMVVSSPLESVVVTVRTWSALEVEVDSEREVLRDSMTVGTVVVTTMGEVAMGMEF